MLEREMWGIWCWTVNMGDFRTGFAVSDDDGWYGMMGGLDVGWFIPLGEILLNQSDTRRPVALGSVP